MHATAHRAHATRGPADQHSIAQVDRQAVQVEQQTQQGESQRGMGTAARQVQQLARAYEQRQVLHAQAVGAHRAP